MEKNCLKYKCERLEKTVISHCENLQRRGQSDKQGADDNVHDALPDLQPSIPQVKNSKTLNLFLDNFNFTRLQYHEELSVLNFRLDEKKAVKSKSWQRYIRNDPLMYHGGYKFAAAQVSFPSLQVETQLLQ